MYLLFLYEILSKHYHNSQSVYYRIADGILLTFFLYIYLGARQGPLFQIFANFLPKTDTFFPKFADMRT